MRGWGIAAGAIIVLWWVMAVFVIPVSATGTAQQTSTPSPIVFFQDDFATYSHRWMESKSPKASAVYGSGVLDLRVESPGVGVWSLPDFDVALPEFQMKAAVTVNGGSTDSVAGFVMGYQDTASRGVSFYEVGATPQGEWRLFFYDDGDWDDLTPEADVTPDPATEADTITLRVAVSGDEFRVWIDDRLAGEIRCPLAESGFGVFARAGRGYVDVSFDDVMVTELIEGDES